MIFLIHFVCVEKCFRYHEIIYTAIYEYWERFEDLIHNKKPKENVEHQNDIIRRMQEEIQQVQDNLGHFNGMSNEERSQRISDLKKAWHDLDVPAEEKNHLAKQIIDRISYVRLNKDAEIKVDFL